MRVLVLLLFFFCIITASIAIALTLSLTLTLILTPTLTISITIATSIANLRREAHSELPGLPVCIFQSIDEALEWCEDHILKFRPGPDGLHGLKFIVRIKVVLVVRVILTVVLLVIVPVVMVAVVVVVVVVVAAAAAAVVVAAAAAVPCAHLIDLCVQVRIVVIGGVGVGRVGGVGVNNVRFILKPMAKSYLYCRWLLQVSCYS